MEIYLEDQLPMYINQQENICNLDRYANVAKKLEKVRKFQYVQSILMKSLIFVFDVSKKEGGIKVVYTSTNSDLNQVI